MSTPIKSAKSLATLAKFLVAATDSSDPKFKEAANSHMVRAGFLKLGEVVTDENRNDLEVKLFKAMASANLDSHKERYLDGVDDDNVQKYVAAQEEQVERIAANMSKLDSLNFVESPEAMEMSCALLDDVTHGIDEETPLREMLFAFEESAFDAAVRMNPEYQSIEDNLTLEEIGKAFVSAASGANRRLGYEGAWRSLMGGMEATGFYSEEGHTYRTFYGDQVLASMVQDHVEGKVPETLFLDQAVYPDRLPEFRTFSGLKINIASDIPRPTEKDFFVVAKVLNDLADKFNDPQFQANFDDQRAVQRMAKQLNSMTEHYSSRLTRESKGFDDYYNSKSLNRASDFAL